jgi:tetratricopeptide (TPR) repeat protein
MILSLSKRIFSIHLVILISTFLFIPFQLKSQPESLNKLSKGLSALYNFDFNSADMSFQEFINVNSEHPSGYYFKSIKNLWIYLDNKNEENLIEFFSYTDTAINKADILIEGDSTEIFSYYILGSVYYQRAAAYTRNEEYLNALWATKMFHNDFNHILSIDSLYYDAHMGLGLYNFAVSQAPHSWRWALILTGIEGDRKIGLDYLKSASKKGKYTKVDAEFYLSQLYSEFFLNYKESEKYLKALSSKYPRNLLFKYALGNVKLKKYELKSAIKNFQNVIQSDDSIFTQLKHYSLLGLGDVFFVQNNFDSAKIFYNEFLNSSTDRHLKGITALKTGLCYLFKGDSSAAIEYFEKTGEGNLDLDEDVYAKFRGEQFVEDLPNSLELALIKAKNIIDAGKFNTAIDTLESLNKLVLSDTLRAELMLYFCEIHYNLGSYKQSLEYAISLLNFEQCETWVKAFACYYAAKVSMELNNFEDAKLFIEYASNYSDFFFENKLADRLNALLYELND